MTIVLPAVMIRNPSDDSIDHEFFSPSCVRYIMVLALWFRKVSRGVLYRR